MAKINLNYFKDPVSGVWREPLSHEMDIFKARNPKAHDQYIAAKAKASGGDGGAVKLPTYVRETAKVDATGPIVANSGPTAPTADFAYYGKLKDGHTGWDSNLSNFTEGGITEALETSGSGMYNYYGDGQSLNLASTIGQGETGLKLLLGNGNGGGGGDTSWSLGKTFDDWTKPGPGGSKFGNVAAGLGSLYGIYAGMQGVKEAKKSVAFQREQYEDQKAQLAKANSDKDAFGLALSAAMPSKKVG